MKKNNLNIKIIIISISAIIIISIFTFFNFDFDKTISCKMDFNDINITDTTNSVEENNTDIQFTSNNEIVNSGKITVNKINTDTNGGRVYVLQNNELCENGIYIVLNSLEQDDNIPLNTDTNDPMRVINTYKKSFVVDTPSKNEIKFKHTDSKQQSYQGELIYQNLISGNAYSIKSDNQNEYIIGQIEPTIDNNKIEYYFHEKSNVVDIDYRYTFLQFKLLKPEVYYRTINIENNTYTDERILLPNNDIYLHDRNYVAADGIAYNINNGENTGAEELDFGNLYYPYSNVLDTETLNSESIDSLLNNEDYNLNQNIFGKTKNSIYIKYTYPGFSYTNSNIARGNIESGKLELYLENTYDESNRADFEFAVPVWIDYKNNSFLFE